MDFGTVFQIFKIFKFIGKWTWKFLKVTGLWWVVLTSWILTEVIMKLPIPIVVDIIGFAWLIVVVLGGWVYIVAQSIMRYKKKDPKFMLYKYLLGMRNDKGFVADKYEYGADEEVTGVVFGKVDGKYIAKKEDKDGHVLVVGGAGSGKSSCIAIPTLWAWKGSVFAIDIKKELYAKTKEQRSNEIKVFDPTDRTANGFNPYYLLEHTDDIYSEAKALAIAIIPLTASENNPYFIQAAQSMLTGFILYYHSLECSFSQTMLELKSRPIQTQIAEVMEHGNPKAKMELNQFDGMDEKTLSNIYSTLSNAITTFATNDDLQYALNGEQDCITPQDLEDGKDIYICIPEHKLEQWKTLLAMMVNQFLKAFERRADGNKEPILFLIDEFARLGKVETVANGLATLRSKNIHIALFVQSKSQLNAIYGNDVAEIIADNCSYKAILKASEPTTQEWCSKLVGTYEQQKVSQSKNKDEFGFNKGAGTSTTIEDKRIIKPEEFAYLNDIVCLFPTGYLRVDKAPYYEIPLTEVTA